MSLLSFVVIVRSYGAQRECLKRLAEFENQNIHR